MLKPLLIVTLLFGFLYFQKESYKWQRIVPLVTKRSEVEVLLGTPVRGTGYILTYETQDEWITIWYGGVNPGKDNPCKWNVSSDTVFSFVVGPKKQMLVSDVKFDLKNFSKFKDPEIGDHFHYFDFKDGIRFSTTMTDGEEVIGGFSCNPNEVDTKKYCGQKQWRSETGTDNIRAYAVLNQVTEDWYTKKSAADKLGLKPIETVLSWRPGNHIRKVSSPSCTNLVCFDLGINTFGLNRYAVAYDTVSWFWKARRKGRLALRPTS